MIRSILLAGAAVMACSPCFGDNLSSSGGRYAIAPSSRIAFTVDQVGGGGIAGRFLGFSGIFVIDPAHLSRSLVSFTLQPGSVETAQPHITSFLRSSAVFDVDQYPSITFRSTKVTQTGPRSATVEGVLAARGIIHGEIFNVALMQHDGRRIVFHVTGDVLRSRYDMGVGTPIYSNVVRFDMTMQGLK